ncbi:MAG: response regulator [Anaerolineales bacterium]|nr:response regulator [Anaerolineales bacterium]
MAQSDGHLQVFSEVGRGAIFNVYFPQVDQTGSLSEPKIAAPELEQEGKTVLLVEDETDMRLFIRTILESSGYTVLEANSGSEALALSQQYHQPIHLLLTEVALMPSIIGRALVEPLLAGRPELSCLPSQVPPMMLCSNRQYRSAARLFCQNLFRPMRSLTRCARY